MSAALAEPPQTAWAQRIRQANAASHKRRKQDALALGKRIRRERLRAGLAQRDLATLVKVSYGTIGAYELGGRIAPLRMVLAIAHAVGCPVAQLLTDELVLAEIRVSPDTLERVKREGQPAAREAAQRIAAGLEALLLAEATRPPVDLSPGARPKRRRTRAEVIAGVAAAEAGRKRNAAARKQRIE